MRALTWILLPLLLIVGGIGVYGALYEPRSELPAGLEGKFVDVMGVRTRYLQAGSGPDILLIHGSPGSVEDWAPIMQALAPDFRVTAYDRPGHGYSSVGPRYDATYNADFAIAMIDALNLQRPVVAGHSYGGATAAAMAIQKPATVRSFVIVDSSLYRWTRPPDPLYGLLAVPALGTGVARVSGRVVAKKIRASLQEIFPGGAVPEGFAEKRIPIWSQPKVTVSLAREALGAPKELTTLSPRYKEISQPIFLIAQGDDPARRENVEMFKRDVPSAEVQLVDGAGHYLQFTRTAEVVALIRRAVATDPELGDRAQRGTP
jgi:pimeloyl-ACP methyl ester carboxylesterase